jgi:DNA-binding CsgD family transcriptional regulator
MDADGGKEIPSSAPLEVGSRDRLEEFRDVLQQRGGPVVYILDDAGTVVMTSPGGPAFPEEARQIIDAMRADVDEASLEVKPTFALEAGLAIRIQPVGGSMGRFMVVLVEPFRLRDHLTPACRKYALTLRECDVLRGLMNGTRTTEIAADLGIAASTVTGHIKSIMAKTSTSSRSEMLARIISHEAER